MMSPLPLCANDILFRNNMNILDLEKKYEIINIKLMASSICWANMKYNAVKPLI